MRIRTKVVSQSGRVIRPAGAVFDVDDETAGKMLVDGTAVPADGTVLPVASAGIPAITGAPAPASGSGAPPAPVEVPVIADEPKAPETETDDEEAEVFAEFDEIDAIAYAETHDDALVLERLLQKERERPVSRPAVIAALDARIVVLMGLTDSPASPEVPSIQEHTQ